MGRPIKKKYFGNLNTGGTGGEGVATIAKNNTGTLYTTSTTIALAFTAPQIAGGIAATGSVTTNGAGNVATVTLTSAGGGYTSIPTATVVGGTTGTTATFTVALTTGVQNALNVTAYIPAAAGGSSAAAGDIVKQESSRRYLVKTAQGTGACQLVTTSTVVAGQMNLAATDSTGGTYWVQKLTAHKATLVANTGTQFTTGAVVGWTLNGATTGTTVTLASI